MREPSVNWISMNVPAIPVKMEESVSIKLPSSSVTVRQDLTDRHARPMSMIVPVLRVRTARYVSILSTATGVAVSQVRHHLHHSFSLVMCYTKMSVIIIVSSSRSSSKLVIVAVVVVVVVVVVVLIIGTKNSFKTLFQHFWNSMFSYSQAIF